MSDATRQRKTARRLGNAGLIILRTVLLTGFAYIILYPVILMVSKSFMAQADVFDNSVLWIPKHLTLTNLKVAFTSMEYLPSLGRSVGFSALGTVMQLIPCMMAGYAFARFSFKGRGVLFALVIFTILVPPQQFLTPLYLHLSHFDIFGLIAALNGGQTINLTSTYIPYFVVSLTGFGLRNGLFIFLFRQAFRGVPRETEEAALVDGAGQLRVFWQIMLPGAVTMMVTVMLFSFVWQYNDTYYAGLLLPNVKMLPQAFDLFNSSLTGWNGDLNISNLLSQYVLDDPKVLSMLRNAAMLLILSPLMLVYAVAQRYFIQSIDRSGLVG